LFIKLLAKKDPKGFDFLLLQFDVELLKNGAAKHFHVKTFRVWIY